MNYQMLMDTAIRVGEIMLSHGAEAHRVEDTVCRMLKTANLKTTEVFVIMTGMFATLSDPSMETITVTKRVRNKGNNLKLTVILCSPFESLSITLDLPMIDQFSLSFTFNINKHSYEVYFLIETFTINSSNILCSILSVVILI